MLDERSIKAAVIDRLFDVGALAEAVLINEMVYANWSRRADLAVANGHLHAFEIKSDFDSLRRLEGQISVYLECFDKLTIVVAPKYLNSVMQLTPNRVAIWCALEEDAGIRIKVIRAGRNEKIIDKDILIGYLLRDEIYRFLVFCGIHVQRSEPRSKLASMAKMHSIEKIRCFVIRALKERYKDSFGNFLNTRKNFTSTEDLISLRKVKDLKIDSTKQSVLVKTGNSPQSIDIDLTRLFPVGEVPSEIPTSIVIRRKVSKTRKALAKNS